MYEIKSSKIVFETPFKSLLSLDALTEIAITLNVVKPLQYSHVWRIIGTNPLIKKVKILSDETDKYNTIPYLFDITAEKIKLDTLELSGSKSLSDLYCITRFNSRMDIRHLFFTRKSREEVNMQALLAAVAYLEKYDPNNVRNIVPNYYEELIAYKRCIKDWRK